MSVLGSTLTINTTRRPSGTESAYLYCRKHHTLTEDTTTLSLSEEALLVLGATAKAASSRASERIGKLNTAGSKVPDQRASWGQRKLTEFTFKLRALTPPYVSQLYPTA